ncbi:hypothetical protein ACJX0J_013683, partial [Zea mays]
MILCHRYISFIFIDFLFFVYTIWCTILIEYYLLAYDYWNGCLYDVWKMIRRGIEFGFTLIHIPLNLWVLLSITKGISPEMVTHEAQEGVSHVVLTLDLQYYILKYMTNRLGIHYNLRETSWPMRDGRRAVLFETPEVNILCIWFLTHEAGNGWICILIQIKQDDLASETVL